MRGNIFSMTISNTIYTRHKRIKICRENPPKPYSNNKKRLFCPNCKKKIIRVKNIFLFMPLHFINVAIKKLNNIKKKLYSFK